MRLQHLMALVDGYSAYSDVQGEVEFVFRHNSPQRLVHLEVSLMRESSGNWLILATAHKDDLEHTDKLRCAQVSEGLAEMVRRAPEWCRLKAH